MNITPTGCSNLAQNCQKLESLIINQVSPLTDRHFMLSGRWFTKLTEVIIMDSPNLTDESFRYLAHATNLRTLKLNENKNLTDATFKYLTKTCTDLRHVSVTDCERISDGTLKCLAALKNLSVLNLADCIRYCKFSLVLMNKTFFLNYLYINRVTDNGVKYLTEGTCASKIRELNLSNCVCVGSQSLILLAKRCKNLSFLTLAFCEQIEEDSIDHIGTLDHLVSMNLSGCNVHDNCLKTIRMRTLKHCSFMDCIQITDFGFQKFVNQCPNLEILDISGCIQLTDNAVKFLAFSCKYLINLNLNGNKMISDVAIQYLSGVCFYLKVLDLSNCNLIT